MEHTVPLIIRQVCLACNDLERTSGMFRAVFGIEHAYSDPDMGQLGVRNEVLALGTDYLELISPVDEHAPASRFLKRQGEGGYMVICQVDSLASQTKIRQRGADLGIRTVLDRNHRDANYLQWHPSDLGGTMLDTAFDHRAEFTGRWDPAGGAPGEYSTNRLPLRLVKVGITCLDPRATAQTWAAITLGEVALDSMQRPFLHLDNTDLYFLPPDDRFSQPRLSRIHVASSETARILDNARNLGLDVYGSRFALCGVEFTVSGD